MIVSIKGKQYAVGFEWFTYPDKEDAKRKLNTMKVKGYSVGMVKNKAGVWHVYAKEGVVKLPPLALAFLDLAGGYYYMKLPEGKVWVLLKGVDGSIIHDGVYENLIDFESRQYSLLSNFLEEGSEKVELSMEDVKLQSSVGSIDLKLPLDKISLRKNKRVLLLLGLACLIGAGYFFLLGKPTKDHLPVSSPKPPPPTPVSPPTDTAQPAPAPKPEPLKVGKIDLSCYEEFYKSALRTGKGQCEWALTPEELLEEVDLELCDSATKKLMNLYGAFQWGQVSYVEEGILAYPFSFVGNVYAEDLKKLKNLTFSNAQLKIEGNPKNLIFTFTGVLICKEKKNA